MRAFGRRGAKPRGDASSAPLHSADPQLATLVAPTPPTQIAICAPATAPTATPAATPAVAPVPTRPPAPVQAPAPAPSPTLISAPSLPPSAPFPELSAPASAQARASAHAPTSAHSPTSAHAPAPSSTHAPALTPSPAPMPEVATRAASLGQAPGSSEAATPAVAAQVVVTPTKATSAPAPQVPKSARAQTQAQTQAQTASSEPGPASSISQVATTAAILTGQPSRKSAFSKKKHVPPAFAEPVRCASPKLSELTTSSHLDSAPDTCRAQAHHSTTHATTHRASTGPSATVERAPGPILHPPAGPTLPMSSQLPISTLPMSEATASAAVQKQVASSAVPRPLEAARLEGTRPTGGQVHSAGGQECLLPISRSSTSHPSVPTRSSGLTTQHKASLTINQGPCHQRSTTHVAPTGQATPPPRNPGPCSLKSKTSTPPPHRHHQGVLKYLPSSLMADQKPDPQTQKHNSKGQRVCLTFESLAGSPIKVCPFVPFRFETSFTVVVTRVVAEAGNRRIFGEWHRVHTNERASHATVPKVQLLLCCDGATRPRVMDARGSGNFSRCGREHWELTAVGGVAPAQNWVQHLGRGIQLQLARPAEIAFKLRKAESQLSRLLVQLADRHGHRVFAAPTGAGAISVLAAGPLPILPEPVLNELEDRFSVVVNQPSHSDTMSLEEASESLLQRLAVSTVASKLHDVGWLAVEYPTRLCRAEALGAQSSQDSTRSILRVPSLDVLCHSSRFKVDCWVVHLELTPAVHVVQPMTLHFARVAQNRADADPYEVHEDCVPQRPPVHVLPALTTAELTHVWKGGVPKQSSAQLAPDLPCSESFVDYWWLVHGYRLPPDALQSFARVEFPRAGFALTYPLTCLWRRPWAMQPMATLSAGPQIIERAIKGLHSLQLLQSSHRLELEDGLLNPHSVPQLPPSRAAATAATAHVPSHEDVFRKEALAADWKQAEADAKRSGKRLLLAPPSQTLQPVELPSQRPGPCKRRRL